MCFHVLLVWGLSGGGGGKDVIVLKKTDKWRKQLFGDFFKKKSIE